MRDFIRKSKAVKVLEEYADRAALTDECTEDTARQCVKIIQALAPCDVAPAAHGKWIDNGIPDSILSGCSVCGFPCGAYSFRFCPNCGAKMDLQDGPTPPDRERTEG